MQKNIGHKPFHLFFFCSISLQKTIILNRLNELKKSLNNNQKKLNSYLKGFNFIGFDNKTHCAKPVLFGLRIYLIVFFTSFR